MDQTSKRINAFFILLIFSMFFFAMPLFAQQAVEQMNSLANTILGIFKSNLVKTILVIALCGAAIAFAVNKDSQRVRNSMIAIIIGAGVLMAAPYLIDLVWVD